MAAALLERARRDAPARRALRVLRCGAEAALLAQRGHLLPWAALAFGTGIGLYLAAPDEPGLTSWLLFGALGIAAWRAAGTVGPTWAPAALGIVLAVAGMGAAGLRSRMVAAPVLAFRYHGPIEGRIVEVDRSGGDVLRLTLDRVVLADLPPARTPHRIRISLHGDQRWLRAEAGRVVMLTGHLSPPSPPSEPGGFDFRRTAWFERLGAVGYTHNPVLSVSEPQGGLWLARLRLRLSAAIRARIPGDAGGLAAAVTTGDRSGLSARATAAMRDSGLYHIVSISGMHMGMLTAFVFGLVRGLVALVPPVALRLDGKKAAALAALPAAAFYLALAGRDVATERAFVMVAVMLLAVLCDRQAVTLRSIAIAAFVVLALRPETLVNAGFQMSFAAVAALAWAFGASRVRHLTLRLGLAGPVVALLLASLVAGIATAPFAAAHFNRVATYGLLANLLATPAMGVLVMPGAVLLAIGAPFGLVQPALLMVDLGCRWTLLVAERVAALDGATRAVLAPGPAVLPLIVLGGAVLLFWRGGGRWLGVPLVALGLALWSQTERPPLLISPDGGVIGLMTGEGRVLSRGTGERFTLSAWLRADGDTASPEEAANRHGLERHERSVAARIGARTVLLVRGQRALDGLEGCAGADLLVTNRTDLLPRPCLALDADLLRARGAVAVWPAADGVRLRFANDGRRRPWTGPPPLEEEPGGPYP
ncbi:ComEC/Rec2 family competence protein [Rubellimicrobium sp. CFH 75288]|uniref:ComEC/Rec2 family competence protein n=1 Tax=Rubellimicrobium sp. CFH 75288 TaxID=2697034 RepID=UPI00352B7961